MGSYAVDRTRWAEFTIFEQMGNIGSEVGRAIKAQRAGKPERVEGAIARALDLFDATTELLVEERSPRTKEVLRARNEFLRLFYDGTFDEQADAVERYFMQYALAARNMRLRSAQPR